MNKYLKRGLKRFLAITIPLIIAFVVFYAPVIYIVERVQGRVLVEHPGWFTGLKPLNIEGFNLVIDEENDAGILIKLSNPNVDWGASSVFYEIEFFNSDTGELLGVIENEAYVMPLQSRYVYVENIVLPEETTQARVTVVFVEWKKTAGFPHTIDIEAEDLDIEEAGDSGVFAWLSGVLVNNTELGLSMADIVSVLYDEEDQFLAAGRTAEEDIIAHEEKTFDIPLIYRFAIDDVAKKEVEVYSNLLQDSAFMSHYGSRGVVHQRSFGDAGSEIYILP